MWDSFVLWFNKVVLPRVTIPDEDKYVSLPRLLKKVGMYMKSEAVVMLCLLQKSRGSTCHIIQEVDRGLMFSKTWLPKHK